MRYDVTIVGGGILGLATGMTLLERHPDLKLALLEKEGGWARHQTGRNSGVIHSGIYYQPGSLKARFARAGSVSIVEFCRHHDLPFEICGKVIVATGDAELPRLEALHQRGLENGLEVKRLNADALREVEPHVAGIAGLLVPSTGIVDYGLVSRTMADAIERRGGDLLLDTRVTGLDPVSGGGGYHVSTSRGDVETSLLINCAGLHSDRMARLGGARSESRIVPFRGEYYELRPEARHLVKNLIYPVPDPAFPFLGVHFTRMIDGAVHAGPNAVLSLKREGYRKSDFNFRDTAEVLAFPGFWRLAGRHLKDGLAEVVRSFSRAAFVRSLQRLIPEVNDGDVQPSPSGVRAQALTPQGKLVDDFLIVEQDAAVHVLNAPSPAATSSLEIARHLAERLEPRLEMKKFVAQGG